MRRDKRSGKAPSSGDAVCWAILAMSLMYLAAQVAVAKARGLL